MALYLQASLSASLSLTDFPRLTFSGFKPRKPVSSQSLSSLSKAVKPVASTRHSTLQLCGTRVYRSHSDSFICPQNDSKEKSLFACSLQTLNTVNNELSTSDGTSTSTRQRTGDAKAVWPTDADEAQPLIQVLSCHSSTKCGTNMRLWSIKIGITSITTEHSFCVKASRNMIHIKVRLGQKRLSRLDKLFGTKDQVAIKKNLKVSGIIDTSSIEARHDRNNVLTLQFTEHTHY